MAKFNFKLQPLLNIKIQMEDNLKNELGKAIQKLEYEKNVLLQIETERDQYISELNNSSSQGVPVGKLKEYSSYISFLRERMESQKENINYAQNIVDKYREQLIKVAQEKEMLEKLKEKKYDAFKREQLKDEQRVIDEVNSFKYNDRLTVEENG